MYHQEDAIGHQSSVGNNITVYGNMQLAHCEKAMQDYLHLSHS